MTEKKPRVLDRAGLHRLLRQQSGVVSRRQVIALGGSANDIRRWVRRREWVRVHPGVYVNHTGPLTRKQRWWGAVLVHEPAALHLSSALEAHGLTRDRSLRSVDEPVQLMIDASRTVAPLPGITVERVRNASTWTMQNRTPPRAKLEFAVLKVASGRDEAGAIALLADACQQGRTTAARLLHTLRQLRRLPGRARLLEVLDDVASGANSVLEHRYLTLVERAHGFPEAERQSTATADGKAVRRDVRYRGQATVVELDGRFGHTDSEDRWDDLDRDLAAAVDGELTIRLGWRHSLEPCRIAVALAAILRTRGWPGDPRPCGPDCLVPDRASSESPGDSDPTPFTRGA